jgi:serine/threonine protein kinase
MQCNLFLLSLFVLSQTQHVQDEICFLDEICIMKRVSHPYIVTYLGCGVLETKDGRFLSIVRFLCKFGASVLRDSVLAPSSLQLLSICVCFQFCSRLLCG